jgi:hypothetical protein
MTAHLRPCPGCSRHVRVSEGACPFCGLLLEPAFRAAPAPIGPSRRLSRAALFAFGTGTMVLTPAVAIDCGTATEVPFYGSAPLSDAGEPAFDGATGVLYGLVPMDSAVPAPDGGSIDAGDASEDSGHEVGSDGAASDGAADAGDADE